LNVRCVAIGVTVLADVQKSLPFQYTSDFPVEDPPNGKPSDALPQQNLKSQTYVEPKLARLTCKVTTPPQTAGGATYMRPPVILSAFVCKEEMVGMQSR
jgi:hypothetical protein